ncbi:MAG: hypothetical protein AAFV37_14305 [Pseudomonadota bacterium]
MTKLQAKMIHALKDALIDAKTQIYRDIDGMRHEQAIIHAQVFVESGMTNVLNAHYAQENRTSEEPVVNNGVTTADKSKQ